MAALIGASAERTISFGPFRLLPMQRLLLEGDRALRLGSRALDILIALTERPGELVSKDELMARVWPKMLVEESNLKVHISALRRAMGDGSGGKRYLVTVPGRGYCFVASVTLERVEATPRQVRPTTQTHNLPALLTRLIGRADVVSNLVEQLPRLRLLTIVGPGGIGKTSVALAIAAELIADYADGVWLVDLAPIGNARLVPSALAAVLALEIRSDDPLPGLINALRDKRMLIALDNCEHVIHGAANLAVGLLRGAPGVRILATSREPLTIEGERLHRLSSLESPPTLASLTATEVKAFSAIQLFIERATASTGELEFDDADIPIVATICRKLDGIPLAIEFAAARVGALGVRGLAARLENRMRVLTNGRRTAPARHQTMYATVDWSFGLLSEGEQRTLSRLAIFAGGFTIQAVGAFVDDPRTVETEVTDQLQALVAKSLVTADVHGAAPRYRLLETTRAYALEKLVESGQHDSVARRQAEYYRDLLETAGTLPTEVAANSWYATYAPEIDNVRAALKWALAPGGNATVAVTLAAASVPLWLEMSLLTECCSWMQAALAKLDEASVVTTRQEMVLQSALGLSLMYVRGVNSGARAALTRASELAESIQNVDFQLRALAALSTFCHRLEEFRGALALGRQAEVISKGSTDAVAISTADCMLTSSLFFLGEHSDSLSYARRVYIGITPAVRRAHIVRSGIDYPMAARCIEAQALWLAGLLDQSAETMRDVLFDAQASGHSVSLSLALTWCGCPISLGLGDLETAERFIALLKDHSEKHALTSFYACGLGFEGQLSAKRGDGAAGERLLRACLDGLREAQYEVLYTPFLSCLAEVLAAAGHLDDGLNAADEALRRTVRNDALWWMPEALRIKGEVLLLSDQADTAIAEDYFRRSLELARQQQALTWELRTATSLARLLCAQRCILKARDILTTVYDRFTEGLGTADLITARRLLDALG